MMRLKFFSSAKSTSYLCARRRLKLNDALDVSFGVQPSTSCHRLSQGHDLLPAYHLVIGKTNSEFDHCSAFHLIAEKCLRYQPYTTKIFQPLPARKNKNVSLSKATSIFYHLLIRLDTTSNLFNPMLQLNDMILIMTFKIVNWVNQTQESSSFN